MSAPTVNRLEFPEIKAQVSDKAAAPLGTRMDLVGHIDVQLTVTLGAANISIGKLFAMVPDDVLRLDRAVDDLVDVSLGGRVIARGHLVAAGNHFGVKIAEICADKP